MATEAVRTVIDRLAAGQRVTREQLQAATAANSSAGGANGFRFAVGAGVLDSVTGREGVVARAWRDGANGWELYEVRLNGTAFGVRRVGELEPIGGKA